MLPETIAFTQEPKGFLREFLARKGYSRIGVLMDGNTRKHCYPMIADSLSDPVLLEVEAGEERKNLETCVQVWQQLTDAGFDRHGLLIVLGGGVLGDMGGFCASTFKRGIDFLLVPTTLLSQVDASIGGKLGIDFQNLKNHIGIFQEPTATLISIPFLKTLPERELRSGFAEVIKHCLISDLEMWETVRSKLLAGQPWEKLIDHSVKFKYLVISQDPKELGLRKILNFGHTIGHAVEGHFLASGSPVFHGEAVAMGMIAESYVALKKGLLKQEEFDQIAGYIGKVYGVVKLPAEKTGILSRMRQDKKNQGKRILMALPEGIGKAVWDVEVSDREILESLEFYGSIQM